METRIDRFGSVREDKINQLKELIAESNNIVFLGGAGVSTESGIPKIFMIFISVSSSILMQGPIRRTRLS